MKRFFLTLTGCLIAAATLFSQTDSSRFSVFQFSFIYPVGTHGIHASQYANDVSLNILAGISRDERVFTLGGLANIVHNNISGWQLAGLYNHAGNNGYGWAMAGLANTIGNNYTGLLMSGLMNVAQNVNGIQMSGLMNVAQNVNGAQLSGLMNVAQNVNGIQMSGLMNVAQDVNGVQMSGLMNVAQNVNGVQLSGLVNVAQNVNGAQIAGLVNRAKTAKGVQLAGLLNVADSSDYPVAIINIIKSGERSIALSYNETGSIIASFRSGGRVTYGIIGLGYNHNAGKQSWLTEGGLGAHINCSTHFRINSELTVENFIKSKKPTFRAGYRLHAAYRFLPHLEVFAGPGVSYMQTNDDSHTAIFPRHSLWKRHNGDNLRQVFIGYQVGAQYIF